MADGYSPGLRPPRRLHRPERPRHHQLRDLDRRRLLGARPVVMITPETGSNTQGLGGFQETEQLPFFEKITKYQVALPAAGAHRRAAVALLRLRHARARPGPVQHPARPVLRRGRLRHPAADPRRARPRRAGEPGRAATELLAGAKFPVILSPAAASSCRTACARSCALAEQLDAPVVSTYLHNDSFPAIRSGCGPIGYQGSQGRDEAARPGRRRPGARHPLGPFGTLPQHGIEYWPKNAQLIQIDTNPRMLGLVKQAAVGVCGDAKGAAADILNRLETANREIAAHGNRDAAPGRDQGSRRPSGSRAEPAGARPTAARSARAARCASWRRRCRPTPW